MRLNQIGQYWDNRAEGYSMSNMAQYNSDEKDTWVGTLLSNAPNRSFLRCLDIGCGPGFLGILMAEKGHNVTSIDYSVEMLEQAQRNSRLVGVSLRLLQMDAQNLDFRDNAFDYIFCRDLTWNLEFPEKAYREWLRVLAPNGRLLIADGNHYLHYYNKDYQEAYESKKENDHPDLMGVDPTPINEIARNLPLSKELRPAWDLDALLRCGAKQVSAKVKYHSFESSVSGKKKDIIRSFLITAEKSL